MGARAMRRWSGSERSINDPSAPAPVIRGAQALVPADDRNPPTILIGAVLICYRRAERLLECWL